MVKYMGITKVFENAFRIRNERNWEHLYVAVDIHGTVIKPTYDNDLEFQFYHNALAVLKLLKEEFGDTFRLIMWTSTSNEYIEKYKNVFKNYGVEFDYVNENPEVVADNQAACTADFSNKFYFNIGLDDKFVFDPEEDWDNIYEYLLYKIATRR